MRVIRLSGNFCERITTILEIVGHGSLGNCSIIVESYKLTTNLVFVTLYTCRWLLEIEELQIKANLVSVM